MNFKLNNTNERLEEVDQLLIGNQKQLVEFKNFTQSLDKDLCKLINLYRETSEQISKQKWVSEELHFLKKQLINSLTLIQRVSEHLNCSELQSDQMFFNQISNSVQDQLNSTLRRNN